jgi:superfamily II DNA or RNA helicase
MPEFTRDALVDLGGWSVLKEAKALVEAKRVKSLQWEGKVLSGIVETGAMRYFPRLNLRSLTFAENRCNCHSGKQGIVCAHAIALCIVEMEGGLISPSIVEEPKREACDERSVMKSLILSDEKGIPARFRILLPPNLAVAALKDRIMVKAEFEVSSGELCPPEKIDRGRAYRIEPSHQLLGGQIETLCGGKLHGLLQLTRRQLMGILEPLKGHPDVFWINKPGQPIPWKGEELAGVHVHLENKADESSERVTTLHSTLFEKEKRTLANSDEKKQPGSSTRLEVDGSPNYLAIRLPGREDVSYFPILDLLKGSGFILEPSNARWWLRDKHKTLNFLSDHYETLKTRFGAVFTSNFQQRLSGLTEMEVRAEVIPLGDAFELQIALNGDVANNKLLEQLNKGKRYVEENEKVFLINQHQLEKLNQISARLSGDPHRAWNTAIRLKAKPQELCDLENVLESASIHFAAPEQWKAKSAALKNLSKLEEAPIPGTTDGVLRLYQKIGVAWMYHLYRNELGGILADEMGLGKTVQAICLIQAIRQSETGAALVVCPAGLVGNWAREILKFAPDLRVYCHHGSGRMKESANWDRDWDVIITSYSTLSLDEALFHEHSFPLVIGDEAQHIKNRRTQHAKSLKRLQSGGRFLLTGTPIENSMEDLISLFEFLLPGYLQKPGKNLSADDRAWYQQRVKERTAPYILRRTKVQVAPELPEKIEQVVYCEMDSVQKALYEKTQRQCAVNIRNLEEKGASEGKLRMAAFTELLRLRQICADPRLVDDQKSVLHSAKFQAFWEILDESIDGGHRILVFSQFVSLLKLLREELENSEIPYCYIDGSTRNRLNEVDRFNNNDTIPVFLISLKAGGTGLNLTGADTVIHYDPWWNPAAESQATDRAHRIGQHKVVTSMKLIVSGSVEEKVQTLQQKKKGLLKELFEESEGMVGKLELAEVKELLLSV